MAKKPDKRSAHDHPRAPAPEPPPPRGSRFGLRKFFAEVSGARLCYGEPVRNGEHVVIPVARVHGRGGLGFGPRGRRGEEGGGGGGGNVSAAPVGFISISPDGASFQPIADPETTARALLTGAVAVVTTASSLLWLRGRARRSALGGAPRRGLLRAGR